MKRFLPDGLSSLAAPVFVFIWSTGFIGARYGMPYTEPATFLVMRFAGVLLLMVPAVRFLNVPMPPRRQISHLAVAGLLLQGGYLLGVFEAIRHGMGAGLAALIVGLQPVLTAVFGAVLGERVTGRQWLGLVLGFGGVALVVAERLSLVGLSALSILMAVGALLSITVGTIYQKRYTPVFDLRAGSVIQFAAALGLVVPVALLTEARTVEWTVPLVGAMLWSIFALSIGATSLLFLLIRRGAATRVASLMYLTPGVTAVMAWLLFGEEITVWMLAGICLTAVGVATMLRRN
ncbi:MAG TPA: DMT family transporter [Thermomicrobiales bacterium]|nr:DMT family transporter [Thermomicrobiales bacterium]